MRQGRAQTLAFALGWFSLALGLAELLAPKHVARVSGLRGREGLLRVYGAREIAAGAGLLLARDRAPWTAARVAGDAMDLATLATGRMPLAGGALAAVAGVTAADVYATTTLLKEKRTHREQRHYSYSTRSGFSRPIAEMRGAWREYREQRASNRRAD